MNVVILGDLFKFPKGLATSNYVRLMAKGLVAAGDQVQVLVPLCTETAARPLNTESRGQVDGVSFEYTTGTPIVPSTWFRQKWVKARARLVTPWRLFDLRRRGLLDAMIFYGGAYSLLVRYTRLCRLLDVPFIVHMTEWRPAHTHRSAWEKQNCQRFHAGVFQRADAFIVISHYLEERVKEGAHQRKSPLPCLRMPILADPEVWQDVKPVVLPRPYLLYCANLDNYLNTVLFIIKAFSTVQLDGLDLVLVGKASPATRRRIWDAAQSVASEDSVQLRTEYVSDEDLRSLYTGAEALLAPLQNDIRSIARFPFKIADYLMSGRPIVSSMIGEVAQYLKDGESAYLSEPDSVESFVSKIREALTSEQQDSIGKAGQQVGRQVFDYRVQCRRLHSFLCSLGNGTG